MKEIRLLKADEIEVRVQSVLERGYIALLYKDARCDMRILDETFGVTNWQRHHEVINGNLFCTVSIYDEEKKQWVEKQDVGTESYTEKEKGQASDSFKRACFNLGIGRELYTAPFIWINYNQGEIIKGKNGKNTVKTKLKVSEIEYSENREINYLVIVDAKNGNERYRFDRNHYRVGKQVNNINQGQILKQTINKAQQNILIKIAAGKNDLAAEVIRKAGYNSSSDILVKDFEKICADLQDAVEYTGD